MVPVFRHSAEFFTPKVTVKHHRRCHNCTWEENKCKQKKRAPAQSQTDVMHDKAHGLFPNLKINKDKEKKKLRFLKSKSNS